MCPLVFPLGIVMDCGSKDTDPNAKVDTPGYYNGPMNAKGDKGSTDAGEK